MFFISELKNISPSLVGSRVEYILFVINVQFIFHLVFQYKKLNPDFPF